MADRDLSFVRLSMVGVVCVALFATLFARLWYLQVIDRSDFQVKAAALQLRVVHEEGPRGRILDRNGRVLVDNKVVIVVGLDHQPFRKMTAGVRNAVFDRLAGTLSSFSIPTTAREIANRYNDKRWGPEDLVPIATTDSPAVELYLAEHSDQYPGVEVRQESVRTYPYGSLAAHLVGYVGEINSEELAAAQQQQGKPGQSPSTTVPGAELKPYQAGDEIGKAGVEASYENDLRGVPSDRVIQVDARGDYMSTVRESQPRAGDDVWLSIDINLQAQAEAMLRQQLDALKGKTDKQGNPLSAPEGSVVIIDPTNGQVLAMASYPTYDPSLLVNGISSDLWATLNDKASGQPLFNWALQGTYAPGSTFKLFTATAALETGLIQPGTRYDDTGSYRVSNCRGERCTFSNAQHESNGSVNVTDAIKVSSDVFFYWIGDQFWQRRGVLGQTPIQDTAKEFGIGQKSGIPLPGEASGRLPTPALMAQNHEQYPQAFPRGTWQTGDNLNTALGQGDVLVTPLQLANAYATFANGGTRWVPQVVSKVTRPTDVGKNPADPSNYTLVRDVSAPKAAQITYSGDHYSTLLSGFQAVVTAPKGTANGAWLANRTAWPMAGKTGTAQVTGKADTSVFVAFGPSGPGVTGPPTYAISVVIPEAGFGADVSAPLAFKVMQPVSTNTLPVAQPNPFADGSTPQAVPAATTLPPQSSTTTVPAPSRGSSPATTLRPYPSTPPPGKPGIHG